MPFTTKKEAEASFDRKNCKTCGSNIPAFSVQQYAFGRNTGKWRKGNVRMFCSDKCRHRSKRAAQGAKSHLLDSSGNAILSKRVKETSPGVFERECSNCHVIKPQTTEFFHTSNKSFKSECKICIRTKHREEARAKMNDPLAEERREIKLAARRRESGYSRPGDELIPEPLPNLDVIPIRERLYSWLKGDRTMEDLTKQLEMDQRAVYRLMHEGEKIRYSTVDEICIKMGWMVWEMYDD